MSPETPRIFRQIVDRLAATRRKETALRVVQGALLVAGVVTAAMLVALLVEAWAYLGVPPRTAIFWVVLSGAAGLAIWKIIVPLLRLTGVLPSEPDETTAAKVGASFPHINDHLVNILQLYRERKEDGLYSPELIDASFEDVRREVDTVDFTAAIDTTPVKNALKSAGGIIGLALLLFLLFPQSFLGAADRMLNYTTSYEAPQPFTFVVEPGNREVVKGETVPVVVRVVGQPLTQITLSSKPAGQVTYDTEVLTASADGLFRYQFASLKATTSYMVHSGDIQSERYTLTVLDRPVVRSLRLRLAFPSYSRIPVRELDDNIGDVTALKGTRISFAIETNKELAAAKLVFNDKTERVLDVSGGKASGNLTLLADRTYRILLQDNEGLTNADPIEYTLRMVPDAFPTAAIPVPGADITIAENARLNMLFRITDDFGFTSLRLAHRLVQSRYEKPAENYSFVDIPIPKDIRNELELAYLWQLSNLSLVPEDVISYYIEVFDNDNISGPKSAKSETYILRLPSLDEVFADLDRTHEVSLEGMKEALKQAEEARKSLEELQQELRKNQQKMTWQEQKKAEELARQYREIQKRVDEVKTMVDQMINEMQENRVLSEETMEKYMELQKLMEEMNSPEFAEAMKKLQQSMLQMTPEMIRQALQEFKFSEENFRQSIERTMNLLKRLQIEQKVDEALKRMEQITNRQDDLQKQAEQANPSDKDRMNELAKRQQDLQRQLDQLRKELADLQQRMEEFPAEMPLSEMQDALDEMDESELAEMMEQIAEQMQQQQMQQAQRGQKQAMQKMGQMMQKLQQMQQALQQNQQRQIVNEMRRALQDLLELSKRQEALKNESGQLDPNSQRLRENAQEQMEVMRDLGKVTEGLGKLSQKTFGITPEMGKSIGDAMRQMNQAMQSLDQRNGNMASQQQGGAMASLNEAANQVQNAMNAMMQSGGQGMGMAGFMQRLGQMSSQQQGINQGTQNLGTGSGGMTPQQQAELGRLAGEQGMVRKSLEQLAREARNSGELSKLLGDLNKAAEEMREVQTDLAQGNINPETLRKQDRILSRLLDSQRSTRERDFEKRRRAEAGKAQQRPSPRDIDLTTQEGRNRLRQDLLRAMEEGYSRDYQELIRKYFEALEQSNN